MRDDRLYLLYIQEAIGRIEEYAQAGREAFLQSALLQDAIIRRLQTLTESTQRISMELKARHPEVDWRALAGFRNVLVHDYLGVDAELVWEIVEKKLPELKGRVEAMRGELGG